MAGSTSGVRSIPQKKIQQGLKSGSGRVYEPPRTFGADGLPTGFVTPQRPDPIRDSGDPIRQVQPTPHPLPTNVQARQYQPPPSPPNINTLAAGGIDKAMSSLGNGTNFAAQQIDPTFEKQTGYAANTMAGVGDIVSQNVIGHGYDANTMAGVGDITSRDVTGQGYEASTMGPAGTASFNNIYAGQLAGTDLGAYTNPYENQVVQQSLSDIERQRLMQQNMGGAAAGAANAFGGARHGISESETNRAFADQMARTASGLRQSGYLNAQQQAQQDITRSMMADTTNQQADMQTGQFNINNDMRVSAANQAALNQSGQFGAAASNQANLANQASSLQAMQATAANAMATQRANQAAQNAASSFGASALNQAGMANQSAALQAAQANAGNTLTAQQANQNAQNAAGQFGASAYNQAASANANRSMQASIANQAAMQQAAQMRASAANSLGSMSNLGFGMGQQIQDRMDQQGMAQQALNQQLINAAKGQYQGFTGAPAASLNPLLQAVGGAPAVGSVTKSNNMGLMDYLKLGAGIKAF